MKQIFFLLLLFLFFIQEINAQNLIPNPSFEEYENGCPVDLNDLPTGWSHFRESPNSFHTCVQPQNLADSLGWAPLNGFGFQYPADGDSYIGLYTFGGAPFKGFDFREYIGTELIEPLEIGEAYYFSMKVAPAVGGYYYIQWLSGNIGMLLTTNSYDWLDNPMPINNFAHVVETSIVTDTTNWTSVEGQFIAQDAYTHIALGNFFLNSLTDTLTFQSNSLGAYYFIDDLCLSKNSNCNQNFVDRLEYENFELFPVPCRSICNGYIEEKVQDVRLFHTGGAEVTNTNWQWDNNRLEIQLGNLTPGVYCVRIKHERGVIEKRIVVV